jgi:hypothetical protein
MPSLVSLRRRLQRGILVFVLSSSLSAAGFVVTLNPQPIPPGRTPRLIHAPQPLPAGGQVQIALNPQPIPPGRS